MSAAETTARDRLRWQQRANRALGLMLEHGVREGLPALTWTVPPLGVLVGDVDTLVGTPVEQRAAFDAWVAYLRAERWDEVVCDTGTVRLSAQFVWGAREDRVTGALRADIRSEGGGF